MENDCTPSSSSGRVGNSSNDTNTNGSEANDEAQDEEPSSNINHIESELESFRLLWKREIELSPNKEKRGISSHLCLNEIQTTEEKAKWLFLSGVKAERLGKLQDAIALYRKAIQLVPDIEFRIEENLEDYYDEYFEESTDESDTGENSSEDYEDLDNLFSKFQRIAEKAGTSKICQAKHEQKGSHISSLPPEIFLYILKWIVGAELDIVSLERMTKVCRGFYLCARDSEIWRLICLRTWDVNIETPNRYGSWRNMFIQRPHLNFNGVYISKTTYVRYGETSFQDANYRPCYLVEYYRYLRFFPDGVVLMLTTPDEPHQSVYQLRYKKSKNPNLMTGRFKLLGSTVMAVVKKPKCETPAPANYYRFRRQRQANIQDIQTFHLELELKNVKKRINYQLSWNHYSIHMVHKNGQETVSNFDIVPSNFPSFWFSRVKSYTAESESPLM